MVIAVAFVSAISAVAVSFSDYYEYTANNIFRYFLTPTELTTLSALCMNEPSFVYRTVDGPKPANVTMNCTIVKNSFTRQMMVNGFHYASSDLFKKKDVQVQVITNQDADRTIAITFIGTN